MWSVHVGVYVIILSSPDWMGIAALIAYKILVMQKRVASFKAVGKDQLSRAVTIIVESCKYSTDIFVMRISSYGTNRFSLLSLACRHDYNICFWVTGRVHCLEFCKLRNVFLWELTWLVIKMCPIIVSPEFQVL